LIEDDGGLDGVSEHVFRPKVSAISLRVPVTENPFHCKVYQHAVSALGSSGSKFLPDYGVEAEN